MWVQNDIVDAVKHTMFRFTKHCIVSIIAMVDLFKKPVF